MFQLEQTQSELVAALAASGSSVIEFYFRRPVRIKAYWAIPSVAEAADAAKVLNCTFVNAGTDGSGSTTLAVLTNDSGLADSTTRKSSAWVAHKVKQIDTENRPGTPTNAQNSNDSIAAGSVVKCTVAKAASTATGNVIVGIDYVVST